MPSTNKVNRRTTPAKPDCNPEIRARIEALNRHKQDSHVIKPFTPSWRRISMPSISHVSLIAPTNHNNSNPFLEMMGRNAFLDSVDRMFRGNNMSPDDYSINLWKVPKPRRQGKDTNIGDNRLRWNITPERRREITASLYGRWVKENEQSASGSYVATLPNQDDQSTVRTLEEDDVTEQGYSFDATSIPLEVTEQSANNPLHSTADNGKPIQMTDTSGNNVVTEQTLGKLDSSSEANESLSDQQSDDTDSDDQSDGSSTEDKSISSALPSVPQITQHFHARYDQWLSLQSDAHIAGIAAAPNKGIGVVTNISSSSGLLALPNNAEYPPALSRDHELQLIEMHITPLSKTPAHEPKRKNGKTSHRKVTSNDPLANNGAKDVASDKSTGDLNSTHSLNDGDENSTALPMSSPAKSFTTAEPKTAPRVAVSLATAATTVGLLALPNNNEHLPPLSRALEQQLINMHVNPLPDPLSSNPKQGKKADSKQESTITDGLGGGFSLAKVEEPNREAIFGFFHDSYDSRTGFQAKSAHNRADVRDGVLKGQNDTTNIQPSPTTIAGLLALPNLTECPPVLSKDFEQRLVAMHANLSFTIEKTDEVEDERAGLNSDDARSFHGKLPPTLAGCAMSQTIEPSGSVAVSAVNTTTRRAPSEPKSPYRPSEPRDRSNSNVSSYPSATSREVSPDPVKELVAEARNTCLGTASLIDFVEELSFNPKNGTTTKKAICRAFIKLTDNEPDTDDQPIVSNISLLRHKTMRRLHLGNVTLLDFLKRVEFRDDSTTVMKTAKVFEQLARDGSLDTVATFANLMSSDSESEG